MTGEFRDRPDSGDDDAVTRRSGDPTGTKFISPACSLPQAAL